MNDQEEVKTEGEEVVETPVVDGEAPVEGGIPAPESTETPTESNESVEGEVKPENEEAVEGTEQPGV